MIPDIDLELIIRLYDYSLTEPGTSFEPGSVRDWFARRSVRSGRWFEQTQANGLLNPDHAARISVHRDPDNPPKRYYMAWIPDPYGDLRALHYVPRRGPPFIRLKPDDVREGVQMATELGLKQGRRDDLRPAVPRPRPVFFLEE